jgi:dCTP deaminase
MTNIDSKANGVFPSQWIAEAINAGMVTATVPFAEGQVQPNSLDLRLSDVAYRVQCSFLPGEEGIQRKLERFKWYDVKPDAEGIVLERNQAYLFQLYERLNLPSEVFARANPKSTTGRLDVFTRLVTEYGTSFDEVRPGYHGPLYLEVVPRSFAIRVRPGDTLSQIRFQCGEPQLTQRETVELLEREAILLSHDLRVLHPDQVTSPSSQGLVLSVSLNRKHEFNRTTTVGYHARKNTGPIDLRGIGKASVRNYWDRIYDDARNVILEPDEFYIFASKELVRLPPEYCAEMLPFDAGSGEVRTHYAGFFDSGFGYSALRPPEFSAAAVVLEVRSRDVPFSIEDGQPLFRVNLMRCTEPPAILYGSQLGSNYQGQRLRLSKQFKPPTEDEDVAETVQPQLDFASI